MKVFAISDLHLSINSNKPMDIFGPVWHNYLQKIEKSWKKVSDNDIVLIGGDISWAMKLEDAMADLKYISQFSGNKILIRGNHDYWWSSITRLRENLPHKMFALQNDAIKLENVIIAGSRGWWAPEDNKTMTPENHKIYKRELIRMELSLKAAKKLQNNNEQIIVLTHYPPMNNKYQKNEMTKLFEDYNVNIVVFGHLHGESHKHKLHFKKNNIKYFLTSCDLVENKLVRII